MLTPPARRVAQVLDGRILKCNTAFSSTGNAQVLDGRTLKANIAKYPRGGGPPASYRGGRGAPRPSGGAYRTSGSVPLGHTCLL